MSVKCSVRVDENIIKNTPKEYLTPKGKLNSDYINAALDYYQNDAKRRAEAAKAAEITKKYRKVFGDIMKEIGALTEGLMYDSEYMHMNNATLKRIRDIIDDFLDNKAEK